MDKMLETREVIYQLNALFYGYADKDTWPESAKDISGCPA
jgi:hypothetical protein